MLTDAAGMPLSIVINGANRHDVVLAEETLNGLQIEKPLLMEGAWFAHGQRLRQQEGGGACQGDGIYAAYP